MNSLKDLAKVLKKSKKIALFTHINPDSDAIGSVFALFYAFRATGKEVDIFIEDKLPSPNKRIVDETVVKTGECNVADYDTFMCCDVSDLNRLGKYSQVYDLKNNTIVLDHHMTTKLIGRYNYIDASISSASELVYDLLKLMKIKMTNKVLTCIYMGLTSDTGSFINSNTNEHSFKVAHEIARAGVDMNFVNEILFKSVTKKQIGFKQYLWNNYKLEKDIAYIVVDYKTLQELKGDYSDCSNFSAKLIQIENIKYSFSLIEREPGFVSLSLRSRAGYNVRAVAEKLGGGGHICASGAKFQAANITKIKKEVLKAIKENI